MRDRFGFIFKLICLGLCALILQQLARLAAPRKAASYSVLAKVEAAAKPTLKTTQTNAPPTDPSKKEGALPPAIKERVNKIVDSEILGPVIRPVPMALLGIAGKDALFRAPNGQTGLLREGEELGG